MKMTILAVLFCIGTAATAQKRIEVSELPKGATEFLNKHFSGISIDKAKKDAEHGEKGYEVILSDGTEIEFWKDGSYREVDGKDKPIPTAYIDPKITDYVTKNYSGKKITHIDYGHKDVDVDLEGKIDLEFSKEGKFLKGEND
jgi:putative PepSY-like beta-lactamase-inhibitor